MAQIIEFPSFQGLTLDLRLMTKGTDTIVQTITGITGKTNDKTLYRATTVDDAHSGIFRVSVIENGGTDIKYSGWVDLSGVDGNEHLAGDYHSILALQDRPRKNRPLSNFDWTMVDATDHATLEPSLTVTVEVRKDGGAFATASNSVTNVGGGLYSINLTADEMNADKVTLKMTATGAATRFYTLFTQPV